MCIGDWNDYLLITQVLERKDNNALRQMIIKDVVIVLGTGTVITISDDDFIYNSSINWGGYILNIESGKYKGKCGYVIMKLKIN